MAAATKPGPVKILVSGDVAGNFDTVFNKANRVHASANGPFAALICVGNFFGSTPQSQQQLTAYIKGEKKIALPSYFICGAEPKGSTECIDLIPGGGRVADNLFYLGRGGCQFVAGLSVCYLSGTYDPVLYRDVPSRTRQIKYENHYLESDIRAIIPMTHRGMDILLTAEWGRNFNQLLPVDATPKQMVSPSSVGSPIIADLASQVPARYHFAGIEDAFLALPPYQNSVHVSRFFGLATAATKTKDKNIYACNITPLSTMSYSDLNTLPEGTTQCPYTAGDRDAPLASMTAFPSSSSAATSSDTTPSSSSSNGAPGKQGSKHKTEQDDQQGGEKRARRDGASSSSSSSASAPAGAGLSDADRARFSTSFISTSATLGSRGGDDATGYTRWNLTPEVKVPPRNYVCNICQEKGHFIKDCPQRKPSRHEREGKRQLPDDYVCKICNQPGHWIQECPDKEKHPRPPRRERAPTNAECWFCLASAGVANHLIVSVGEENYMALPKGGLSESHVLILPITHVTASPDLTEKGLEEMERYKKTLRQFYEKTDEVPVFYERNIPTRMATHMHLQVVPIPKAKAGELKAFIDQEAKLIDIEFQTYAPEISLQRTVGPNPFLAFELYDQSKMIHFVTDGRKRGLFDFARDALAKFLGTPDKRDWKACQVSEQEESDQTDRIKDRFKPFDWTLEDDA